MFVCLFCLVVFVWALAWRLGISSGRFSPPIPATRKHGWSRHSSSIIPSKHSTPQDIYIYIYSPWLNLMNSARTMFTPTMFSRRRLLQSAIFDYWTVSRPPEARPYPEKCYRCCYVAKPLETAVGACRRREESNNLLLKEDPKAREVRKARQKRLECANMRQEEKRVDRIRKDK